MQAWSNIFTGAFLWSIIMMLPVLIVYFYNSLPLVSSALLTVLYPVALSILSRRGEFWVSYPVVMGASVCALFMWIILSATGVTNKDVIMFVPVSTFIFGMLVLGSQMDMYGPEVAGGGGGGGYND